MRNPLFAAFAGQVVMVASEMQAGFEANLHAAELELANFQARDRSGPPAQMTDDFWFADGDWRSWIRPYVVKDGVLQIPVKGVLLKDFPYAFGSYATGYEYIWRAYERGMDDSNVRKIALIVNSPGGLVAGNFDLVDKMFARRDEKPVRAFASEHAYSAAYSIASVAGDGLVVARTGGVGSIGVVAMHVEVSEALEKSGVKVTFIKKGAHKTDGNPYEPLGKDTLARLEAKMEVPYDIFVKTVARNRGLEEQAVRDTEAMTFTAPEALSNGLADQVGALDDALADFASGETQDGDDEMAGQADTPAVDQAAIDTARAEGVTQGQAEGATAERARIAAILDSDEAKARPAAARMLAFDTDKDADSARASLAKLPEEAAANAAAAEEPKTNAFEQAMDKSKNPELGAGDGEAAEQSASDRILTLRFGSAK